MLTYSDANLNPDSHELYAIGIKSCGAMPRSLPGQFPLLARHIIHACQDRSLHVGELFTWEEGGKHILVCVTSTARLRETSVEDFEGFLQEIVNTSEFFKFNDVAMQGLCLELLPKFTDLLDKYLTLESQEFFYYG